MVTRQPSLSPPLLDFPKTFRHSRPIFKLGEFLTKLHLLNPPPPPPPDNTFTMPCTLGYSWAILVLVRMIPDFLTLISGESAVVGLRDWRVMTVHQVVAFTLI